ncbi:MAG: saccharopine dehydrogenase C-terminal domain-containing protein [Thermoplasmata archaeon]
MGGVLVLGAGMISRPMVSYLLDHTKYPVVVASRTISKVRRILGGHPRGEAKEVDATKADALEPLVRDAELVVSLLPYVYHPMVARICLKHGKHLVTTSYVSPAMRALDPDFKSAGLISLNEIGLDPGIDHMSAMRVIDSVKREGGEIVAFSSYCGALPAPEAALNPFGYKFSWSPRGVLLASRNAARFLKDGKVVDIPGNELFENYTFKEVPGVGWFEEYPNRDSIPYLDTYGIRSARTMYRATLRNIGWCETMRKIAELGLLDDTERGGLENLTWAGLMAEKLGCGSGDIKSALARRLRVPVGSTVIKRLEWLGLLADERLPAEKSVLDALTALMLRKLSYGDRERDMVVLHHEFVARMGDGATRYLTSTLVDFGVPGGDTAVARTVSYPAAIAVRLILEGKITARGVQVPVIPEIYEPVLKELEGLGIKTVERSGASGMEFRDESNRTK